MGNTSKSLNISGLDDASVADRRKKGLTNQVEEDKSNSYGKIISTNIFTYFNLIFFVQAILLILVGAYRDLTFMPVIVFNTLIGIVQEIRAKRTLDNLNMLNAPKALVVRNGKEMEIPAEDLVKDDIVKFSSGNQVCADAVVYSGEVFVNESLLTGENDEILKKENDNLMSGSFIVSGECYGKLVNVGKESYIAKLSAQAKKVKKGEQSEMIRSLDKLLKVVGVAIIPIGICIFVLSKYVYDHTVKESVCKMIAAIIGMIPEGLYLLTSIALAVSTIKLAKRKVLLHNMKCIETLARVDVLCVDKTGTITDPVMHVDKVISENKNYTVEEMEYSIGSFANIMSKDNVTMETIKNHFTKYQDKEVIDKVNFSSVGKYSGVVFEDATYVLGAPEFLLFEEFDSYKSDLSEYIDNGSRVLAYGTTNEELDGKRLKHKIDLIGFIILNNPVREGAKETFTYFAEQGVDIKVISGDNPETVSRVAEKAGINNSDKYIDASSLDNEVAMSDALEQYTVFGRVNPEQKREIVKCLKRKGHTVAMTGDGVNDILALRDADCSIAMASGSEAATQTAQLVLLDSDFSSMPHVVWEGRRVVNNIQRSASLFLVKNILSALLFLISVLFTFAYPFVPSQISLVSMFTIGMPAFLLALEPNKNIIKGHFLTNVMLKALPAGIVDTMITGIIICLGENLGLAEGEASTIATLLLAIVGFVILYQISVPLNKYRSIVIAFAFVVFYIASTKLSFLFGIENISRKGTIVFVIFALLVIPLVDIWELIIEKIRLKYMERKHKTKENA
ncbi:MAG: cation-translocating P-type ATPase [Lachnospiraceae bacterium]|nr:cation-translocating P-type ATPase [Lachnospiraceae bacterium]